MAMESVMTQAPLSQSKRPQPTRAQDAASLAAVKLLREIVDYQRRLRRLREHEASGDQAYLISAYRRAMTLRRELLDDLHKPPESISSPFESSR
jgi:hypothetical protein